MPISDLSQARKNIDTRGEEIRSKISEATGHAGDLAGDFYAEASNWVEKHGARTLGIVGVLAAAGMVGYFIGRNSTKHPTS